MDGYQTSMAFHSYPTLRQNIKKKGHRTPCSVPAPFVVLLYQLFFLDHFAFNIQTNHFGNAIGSYRDHFLNM